MRIIEVIQYQSIWAELFAAEEHLLVDAIGSLEPAIHHIGSTSVPSLAAKPIIDILLEVDDAQQLDKYTESFQHIGYHGRGELGIPGRRFFQKGGDQRSHQIHAFQRGCADVIRHIAFRDYLISHPDIAAEYGALKQQVASRCNHDIDRYCDGKNEFVQRHETLALACWQQNLKPHLPKGTG